MLNEQERHRFAGGSLQVAPSDWVFLNQDNNRQGIFLHGARRLVAKAIAAHDPYLRFSKFPAWRAVWSHHARAALRRKALFH